MVFIDIRILNSRGIVCGTSCCLGDRRTEFKIAARLGSYWKYFCRLFYWNPLACNWFQKSLGRFM